MGGLHLVLTTLEPGPASPKTFPPRIRRDEHGFLNLFIFSCLCPFLSLPCDSAKAHLVVATMRRGWVTPSGLSVA